VRLNKECILSAPKRQKDRVAELEAQVAALTRLLQAQGIQDPAITRSASGDSSTADDAPPSVEPVSAGTKKRRLASEAITPASTLVGSPSPIDPEASDVSRVDRIISYDVQERLLERYRTQIMPNFPLCPIDFDCSLASLRCDRPLLLQAILYAASPGALALTKQEELARILLERVANDANSEGEKSLELIQSIGLACLWYRSPKSHRQVAVYQLVQFAADLADAFGAEGPLTQHMGGYHIKGEQVDLIDSCRTWLGCHLLTSVMSQLMRQPRTTTWTTNHDQSLLMLQYSPVNETSDKWLGQYFRAEHVLDEISEQMEFNDMTAYHDVSEPSMKHKIQTCRNKILNWKMTIPQVVRTPTLLFWEHVAIAYMHEPLLHTATNKRSFAAPYSISDGLSLTDFPKPVVTQDHITAIYELVTALQNIIETFATFDDRTLLALPGLLYAARAAYALKMLAKAYIAVSAPGNTLGAVLEAAVVALPHYTEKLASAAARYQALDGRSAPSRILHAAEMMRDWYANYTSFFAPDFTAGIPSLQPSPEASVSVSPMQQAPPPPPPPSSSDLGPQTSVAEWAALWQFNDASADFGLDALFPETMSLPAPGFDAVYQT
jgi:hypothetical protein